MGRDSELKKYAITSTFVSGICGSCVVAGAIVLLRLCTLRFANIVVGFLAPVEVVIFGFEEVMRGGLLKRKLVVVGGPSYFYCQPMTW